MFASTTDVANFALDLLSEAQISSLSENNPAARALNRQINLSRDIVLAESQWKFAKRTKALSNDATAPIHPRWPYRSALPGDLVTIIHLWDTNPDSVDARPLPEERWDREANFIHHDLEANIALEYISNETGYGATASLWSPKAGEAWAYHLAASTAKKIQGNENSGPGLMQQYIQDKLVTAQIKEGHQGRVNENEGTMKRVKRNNLVRSRRNYRF